MNIVEAMKILDDGGMIQRGEDPHTQRFQKEDGIIYCYEWYDSYNGISYFKAEGNYEFSPDDIRREDWINVDF